MTSLIQMNLIQNLQLIIEDSVSDQVSVEDAAIGVKTKGLDLLD